MIFYAISDRKLAEGGSLLRQLGLYLELGPDWIQIREKDMSDRELFEAASAFSPRAGAAGVKLFINGRPDIAAASGACGVHLPSDSIPVEAVKRAFPSLAVVKSCHSEQEAVEAGRQGADAVTMGPVYPTLSKPGVLEPIGTAGLAEICRRAGVPVIALGGMNARNIVEAKEAGAAGVAGIGMFNSSEALNIDELRKKTV